MGEEGNGADAKQKKGTGAVNVGGGEGGGGDPGNGKATANKKNNGDGGGQGNSNHKASTAPVVLRVELHCEGCARKVKKAIKAAQGVEGVATDMAASTVTVSGKADPWDLKERIESRTHKPVAFLSPPNPNNNKPSAASSEAKSKSCKTTADRDDKNEELPESTVVVKIRLHCNGCIDRIKRTATKIKGVKQVTVDTAKEHVTVKGTMDAKALPDVLRGKLKREVAVVPAPAKKDGTDGDKKKNKQQQQQQGGDEDKDGAEQQQQQQQQASGGGKKKNKNKKQDGEGEEGGGAAESTMLAAAVAEQPFPVAMMYGPGVGGSSYRVEMLHAPQLFSDENPNACAIM